MPSPTLSSLPALRPLLHSLGRFWRAALHACFALLCVRFLVAAFQQAHPTVWPTVALAAGSMGLGAWSIRATLIAFAATVPWLNGLEQTALLPGASLASLTFCGIFLGWGLRVALDLGKARQDNRPRFPASGGDHVAEDGAQKTEDRGQQRQTNPLVPRPLVPSPASPAIGRQAFSLLPSPSSLLPHRYSCAINLLITIVLASLAWQMVRHPDHAALWAAFWRRPAFGFGDPLYFLTSAFVWLQGLFFLKLLLHGVTVSSQVDSGRRKESLTSGLMLLFLSYSLSLLSFALVQRHWQLPDKYHVANTSPLEDIHSFGAIAVTCLVFFIAAWRFKPPSRTIGNGFCVAALLTLVIFSWSRATWLAGFVAIALVVLFRVSWKWRIVLMLAGVGLLVAANHGAKTAAWQNNAYLWRLGNLVRFESPMQKDPSRMNLYHKAFGLIQERPLTGHGIGSFYLKSINYAQTGDPYATVPNFAHNFLLQFAAELGVPAALLLAALIVLALVRGYKLSRKAIRTPGSDLTTFGLTMALTAYLITQMTANALNIYPSNQFFFWFLVAAMFTWPDSQPDKASGPDSAGAVTR